MRHVFIACFALLPILAWAEPVTIFTPGVKVLGEYIQGLHVYSAKLLGRTSQTNVYLAETELTSPDNTIKVFCKVTVKRVSDNYFTVLSEDCVKND